MRCPTCHRPDACESSASCPYANDPITAPSESPRWREDRHWQADAGRFSCWFGISADRWMLGVVFNTDSLTLGFGLGPVYVGCGAIRP